VSHEGGAKQAPTAGSLMGRANGGVKHSHKGRKDARARTTGDKEGRR
jgi:hypothetical protein